MSVVPDMPAFLETETEEVIRNRMLSKIPDDIDKSEGSYIWLAAAPMAAEIAQLKVDANQLLNRAFIPTTYGKYLDMKVGERGTLRNEAIATVWEMTIKAVSGTAIPKDYLCSTQADADGAGAIMFKFLDTVYADANGDATGQVECETAGEIGNVPVGSITIMNKSVNGLISISNSTMITRGAEAEEDDPLRDRGLAKEQKPLTSGNIACYETWAKDVTGVTDDLVLPLADGNGTVKLVITGPDNTPAMPELIQSTKDLIDPQPEGKGNGLAPIGATVTVITWAERLIDISYKRTLKDKYDDATVDAAVETNLGTLIQALKPGETVLFNGIQNTIFNTEGIYNYSDVTVNGGTEDIPISQLEKAVKGTVTRL